MTMKKKLFAAVAAAALVGAITAGTASATQYSQVSNPTFHITKGVGPRFDTAVATGTVYPTVGNFNDVTMNGSPQLTSAVIDPFTVIDDSGSGLGWNVTLQVTDFTDGAGNVVPSAGVQMNDPVVAGGNAQSLMGGVWGIPNVDFTAAKEIVKADPADIAHSGGAPFGPDGTTLVAGMGTYLVSPQILKLIVPADAVAAVGPGDLYTATATIAITSGP